MKRFFTFLLAISALFACSVTAYAHDVPQDRDDCTIELLVRYDGKDINGGTVTAIQVGYVYEEDGNYYFRQAFTGELIADVASPTAPADQMAFYQGNEKEYDFYTQTQPVKDGKATFTDLTTGLYLIVQEEPAYGYTNFDAFLVTVPYMQDGKYQYNVTAAIKSELEREPEPTDPPPTRPDDPRLPKTGQLNWPIPLMAVAGLGFFIIGWGLTFGKKRERNEE